MTTSSPRNTGPTALSREHLRILRRVAEILTAMPYEAGRVRALEAIQRAVFAGGERAGAVLKAANLGALALTLVDATAALRASDRPGAATQADTLERARRLLTRLERPAPPQRPLPTPPSLPTHHARIRTHQGTTQFTTHVQLTEQALPDDHASWYGSFSMPAIPGLRADDILDLELADGRRGQAVVHRVLVANSAQRVQFLGLERLR